MNKVRVVIEQMGKWPLGLIGGGALIFFVGLSLGHSPVAVLGAIIFLIGIFLTKWSKLAKSTIGLIGGGILIFFVALSLGHWPVAVFGAILFVIGGFLAKIFYQA